MPRRPDGFQAWDENVYAGLSKEEIAEEKKLRAVAKIKKGDESPFYVTALREIGMLEKATELAHRHGVAVMELFGPGRQQRKCNARLEVYRYLRELGWSYPDIGRLFCRDHTTVMDAMKGSKRGSGEKRI